MTSCERDVVTASVVECRSSGRDGFLLRVALAQPFAGPLEGGHFFMVRTVGSDFPLLNRPFSAHDVRRCRGGLEIAFLFKAIGSGTRCLSRLRAGDSVLLVGPLGRPFPAGGVGDPAVGESTAGEATANEATPPATTLLVAGGVGLPPLFLWLRRRQEEGRRDPAVLLYGARYRDQLFELEAASALGVPVRTATEDGSHGLHGRVDHLLRQTLDELAGHSVRIFTCGPDPMMAAVARLAIERRVPCLASLETVMACGFGVCNACAVPVTAGDGKLARYARACIDGPVMDGATVLWQHAAH